MERSWNFIPREDNISEKDVFVEIHLLVEYQRDLVTLLTELNCR